MDGEQADEEHLEQGDDAHFLRARGQERGDRRGRALVHVRRPHVERDDCDLEPEAGEEEDDCNDQRGLHRGDRAPEPRRRARSPEYVEVREGLSKLRDRARARHAVDDRDPEEDDRARHRSDDEELQRGLRRRFVLLPERDEGKGAERANLEREV